MSLKRLRKPDDATDIDDTRERVPPFSQEVRQQNIELEPSYSSGLFDSKNRLHVNNDVPRNLTVSSQDVKSTEGYREDLTADILTSTAEEMVCYGMFYNEKVKLVGQGEELQKKLQEIRNSGSHISTLRVRASAESHLFLKFADNKNLGYLNEKIERGLKDLAEESNIELDAVVNLPNLSGVLQRAQEQSEAVISVDLNIYGPEASRDRVGTYLSERKLFLQVPDKPREGVKCDNPHIMHFDGLGESEREDSDSDSDASPSTNKTETFKRPKRKSSTQGKRRLE